MIWTLVLRYWKIWIPGLAILLVAGTVLAMSKRIDFLKEDRDVAVAEHDKAMEENRRLADSIKRLDGIIRENQKRDRERDGKYQDALARIKRLAADRGDVAGWLGNPIPDGLWTAATEDSPSTATKHISGTNSSPVMGPENKRGPSDTLSGD